MSNILQKSSSLDERVIEDGIQKLKKKLNQLKGEIYEVVKQNYAEFQSHVDSTVSLDQRVREITSEYRRLAGRIEQDLKGRIHQSTGKRQEIDSRLHETQGRIAFVQNLVFAFQDIEASRRDLQSERFGSAASRLNKTADCLDEIEKADCNAKVFRALKSGLAEVTSELSYRLLEEWGQFVIWKPKLVPEKPTLTALLSVELRVPLRAGSSLTHLDEVIAAMKQLVYEGVWEQKAVSFGKKLLKCIVEPLITNPGVKAVQSQEKNILILRLLKANETVSPGHRVFVLYDSLLTVFSFVRQIVPEVHQAEWMLLLGEEVCFEMTELTIKNHLAASIPKSLSELESYGEISTKTAEFEAKLCKIGIVEDFHQLIRLLLVKTY